MPKFKLPTTRTTKAPNTRRNTRSTKLDLPQDVDIPIGLNAQSEQEISTPEVNQNGMDDSNQTDEEDEVAFRGFETSDENNEQLSQHEKSKTKIGDDEATEINEAALKNTAESLLGQANGLIEQLSAFVKLLECM